MVITTRFDDDIYPETEKDLIELQQIGNQKIAEFLTVENYLQACLTISSLIYNFNKD